MALETRCDKISWAAVSADVQTKLDYLRLAWQASERDCPPELHKKMVKDLYMPMMELIALFCGSITVGDDDKPSTRRRGS